MVSITFLNYEPYNSKTFLRHKNGVKTDNRVENLEVTNIEDLQNDGDDTEQVNTGRRRRMSTSITAIADYWSNNPKKICETELNFDWSEAKTHCWGCGKKDSKLERCHIIPHALGGEDTPSNYVLLCNMCHIESPDSTDPSHIWDWIKSKYIPFSLYDTYKIREALVMFKQKEGFSFFRVLYGCGYRNFNKKNT